MEDPGRLPKTLDNSGGHRKLSAHREGDDDSEVPEDAGDSEDLEDLRRTALSDLVTRVEYVYWDERFEKWESETEPKEGEGDDQFILPRFIKLTFEYESVTKERTLTIPVTSRRAFIF